MEHYYVINGNEYGANLSTKKNFANIEDAVDHFDKVKDNDYVCVLMHVNAVGIEKTVNTFINED